MQRLARRADEHLPYALALPSERPFLPFVRNPVRLTAAGVFREGASNC